VKALARLWEMKGGLQGSGESFGGEKGGEGWFDLGERENWNNHI